MSCIHSEWTKYDTTHGRGVKCRFSHLLSRYCCCDGHAICSCLWPLRNFSFSLVDLLRVTAKLVSYLLFCGAPYYSPQAVLIRICSLNLSRLIGGLSAVFGSAAQVSVDLQQSESLHISTLHFHSAPLPLWILSDCSSSPPPFLLFLFHHSPGSPLFSQRNISVDASLLEVSTASVTAESDCEVVTFTCQGDDLRP